MTDHLERADIESAMSYQRKIAKLEMENASILMANKLAVDALVVIKVENAVLTERKAGLEIMVREAYRHIAGRQALTYEVHPHWAYRVAHSEVYGREWPHWSTPITA